MLIKYLVIPVSISCILAYGKIENTNRMHNTNGNFADNQSNSRTPRRIDNSTKSDTQTTFNIVPLDNHTRLKNCFITFGVPATTDDEWSGSHILFADLVVHYRNKSVRARGEYRNQPIGKGNAIFINIPFEKKVMDDIYYDDITQIDIYLLVRLGDVTDGGGGCKFRTEAVLLFPNPNDPEHDLVISTGYNDPAQMIYPLARDVPEPAYSYKREVGKAQFLHAQYLKKDIN